MINIYKINKNILVRYIIFIIQVIIMIIDFRIIKIIINYIIIRPKKIIKINITNIITNALAF